MNKQQLPLEELYPFIEQMLELQGTATFTVSGWSMQPMVYNRRDTVTIIKAKLPLKKYDIPLYKMDNGQFLLHRVICVHSDGTYECRGDNRWESEYSIRDDQIIGVVKSFTRNGKKVDVDKSFGYYIYTRTWAFMHHFKKFYHLPQRLKKRFHKFKLRMRDNCRNRAKTKIMTEVGVMKKVQYRMATAADMKYIYKLSSDFNAYELKKFKSSILRPNWGTTDRGQIFYQKMRKDHFLWVATFENIPIAYCVGYIMMDNAAYKCPVAELSKLYIDDEYRGMGIGSKLIEILKDYCKTRGCQKIKVTFMDGNEPAEGVCSKHGFKPYEKIYLCDIDG